MNAKIKKQNIKVVSAKDFAETRALRTSAPRFVPSPKTKDGDQKVKELAKKIFDRGLD